MENKANVKPRRLYGLKTLFLMQVKQTMSFSFRKDPKGALTKLLLQFLGIAAITAVLYLVLVLFGFLGIFGLGGYVPMPIWNTFFFLILLLNFFSCLFKTTDALYFSQDNRILLALPVSSSAVYLSKILVFFIAELKRSLITIVPILVSFGIAYRMPWFFFLWIVPVTIILSALPVSVSAVLAIPLLYAKRFLRRFSLVQTVLVLTALIVATVLLFYLCSLVPEDLQILNKWVTVYLPALTEICRVIQTVLYPLIFLSHLAVGYTGLGSDVPGYMTVFTPWTGLILVVLLLIIVGLVLFTVYAAQPLYLKMASYSSEFDKQATSRTFKTRSDCFSAESQVIFFDEANLSDSDAMRALEIFYRRHYEAQTLDEALPLLREIAHSEVISLAPVGDAERFFALVPNHNKAELCFVRKPKGAAKAICYCPVHEKAVNRKKPSLITNFVKEISSMGRDYKTAASLYLLFIVTPTATLLLNTVFESMRKSFLGQILTVIFNALIIPLILLASNVSIASIYSREGRASYQIFSAPRSLLYSLWSKLFLRALIMTASIGLTVVVYANHCSMSYVRMDYLFFCFLFLFLGHLLWSAELDYMNPMVHLYTTSSNGLVINKNEMATSILAVLVSVAFAGLTFLFVNENTQEGFVRLLIVCSLFLVARIILFVLKVKTYGAEPFEGRGSK